MKRWISMFAMASLLAGSGCMGAAPSGVVPGAATQVPATTSRSDLLYAGRALKKRTGFIGEISVMTFPDGTPVATIAVPGFVNALCSDNAGNIWAILAVHKGFVADEFARGETEPIAHISIAHSHGNADACAVDPTTGNLAVMVGIYDGSGPMTFADIYAGARPGKPRIVALDFTPTACAYDSAGDLFADGYVGSTVFFALAELAAKAKSFSTIHLDKPVGNYPGGVVWDGTYVDIVTSQFSRRPAIYRVSISGQKGHVAGIVHPRYMTYDAALALDGDTIAANGGDQGRGVDAWAYPAGGAPIRRLAKYNYGARGLAISKAP